VGDLFLALDHRVPGSAASIGQLCTGAECDRFGGRIGQLPFDVVASGLQPMLFRSAPDVSDDTKVVIVKKLVDSKLADAWAFIAEVQKAWPAGMSPRVKKALDDAVAATAGAKQ
jgi:hypothetical protein